MKKIILVPLLLLIVMPGMAQRGYVKRAMEDKYEKEHGDAGMAKYNEWMNGKVMNVKTEPEYKFTKSLTMQVTDYKNGKKRDATEVQYFINPAKTYFGTATTDKKKDNEMFMIYAMKENYMLMLDTKKMTGMAINMNAFMSGKAIEARDKRMSGDGDEKPTKSNTNCNKTGKSKTIQGYSSDEYVCKDPDRDTRTEMWMTNKINVNMAQANMRGPYAAYFMGMGNMGGMIMEANFYKRDELQSTMLVTDVNENANRVEVMKNYKLN